MEKNKSRASNRILRLFTLLLLLIQQSCGTKSKITYSNREIPSWVTAIEPGYIVSRATGSNFYEAKENAIKKVKFQIAREIAEYIQINTQVSLGNQVSNNKVLTNEILTSAAIRKTPGTVLTAVSLSKVTAYYWEKSSSDYGEKITYYIKYPFPNSDREKIMKEWMESFNKDKKRLERLFKKEVHCSSLSTLRKDLKELEKVSDFIKIQFNSQIQTYKQQIFAWVESLEICVIKNEVGELAVSLCRNNFIITDAPKPKIEGEAITVENAFETKEGWEFRYSLLEASRNGVWIHFNIFNRRVSEYVNLNYYAEELKARLVGDIHFNILAQSFTGLDKVKMMIPIQTLRPSNYSLKVIELEVHRKRKYFWSAYGEIVSVGTVKIFNMHKSIQKEGIHRIYVVLNHTLDNLKIKATDQLILDGKLTFHSEKTGRKEHLYIKDINVIMK